MVWELAISPKSSNIVNLELRLDCSLPSAIVWRQDGSLVLHIKGQTPITVTPIYEHGEELSGHFILCLQRMSSSGGGEGDDGGGGDESGAGDNTGGIYVVSRVGVWVR